MLFSLLRLEVVLHFTSMLRISRAVGTEYITDPTTEITFSSKGDSHLSRMIDEDIQSCTSFVKSDQYPNQWMQVKFSSTKSIGAIFVFTRENKYKSGDLVVHAHDSVPIDLN